MIIGVGIDMVDIRRIKASLRQHGSRFIEKIAHPVELEKQPLSDPRRSEYWAARFAAKEAFAKALGTGIGKTVGWKAVGVKKTKTGMPTLQLSTSLKAHLKTRGVVKAHLTITHSEHSAFAMVILEKK